MKTIKLFSSDKFGRDEKEAIIHSAISFSSPEIELLSYNEGVGYLLNSKNYLYSSYSTSRTIVCFLSLGQEKRFIKEMNLKKYKKLPDLEQIWIDKNNINSYFWHQFHKAKKVTLSYLKELKTINYCIPFGMTEQKKEITENLVIQHGRYGYFLLNDYNSYWGTSSFELYIIDMENKIVIPEKEYQNLAGFTQSISDIKEYLVSGYKGKI